MLEPGQLQELSLRFTSPALSLLTLTGYFYIFPYVTRSGSALVSTLSEAKGKKPTVNSSNGLPADCFSKCHPGSLPWHLGGNSSSFWGALGNNQHGVSRAAQNLQEESKMALTGLQLHHSCVCWVSDPSLCLPQNHPRTKAPWACYNHSSTKPLGQAGHCWRVPSTSPAHPSTGSTWKCHPMHSIQEQGSEPRPRARLHLREKISQPAKPCHSFSQWHFQKTSLEKLGAVDKS